MPKTKKILLDSFPEYYDYILERWDDEHWKDEFNWGEDFPSNEDIFDNIFEEVKLMGKIDYRNKLIKEFPNDEDFIISAFDTEKYACHSKVDVPVYISMHENVNKLLIKKNTRMENITNSATLKIKK